MGHRLLARAAAALVAVATLALGTAGCGDDGGKTAKPTSSRGPTVAEARAALTRYVDAVNAGKIDEAMAARCEEARVKAENLSLFSQQAKALVTAVGPITVRSVQKADPPSGLRPLAFVSARTEVSYRVVIKGAPTGRDLRTVVIHQAGEARLCGFATGAAKQLHEKLPKEVDDIGATAKDLVELMPATIGAGYRQTVDDAGAPSRPNMTRSWTRAWQGGDTAVSVTAAKYTITPSASTDAAMLAEAVASDGVEEFRVPGVPKAVGVRYLGYAWLWIQPTALAPFVDQVVLRFGDKVVIVTVANPPGAGRETINRIVTEIVKGAVRSG